MLLLAVPLLLGLALVGISAVTAATFLRLLGGPEVRIGRGGAPTTRRQAWLDPNEAARAAGSWG